LPNIAPYIVGNLAINLLIYLKYIDFNYKLEISVKNCRFVNPCLIYPPALLLTIKGRLLSSRPMLKPFSGEKNYIPSKCGPKMTVFEKMEV